MREINLCLYIGSICFVKLTKIKNCGKIRSLFISDNASIILFQLASVL